MKIQIRISSEPSTRTTAKLISRTSSWLWPTLVIELNSKLRSLTKWRITKTRGKTRLKLKMETSDYLSFYHLKAGNSKQFTRTRSTADRTIYTAIKVQDLPPNICTKIKRQSIPENQMSQLLTTLNRGSFPNTSRNSNSVNHLGRRSSKARNPHAPRVRAPAIPAGNHLATYPCKRIAEAFIINFLRASHKAKSPKLPCTRFMRKTNWKFGIVKRFNQRRKLLNTLSR